MKLAKVITSLVIAGLVLTSCKKNTTETSETAKAATSLPKEQKEIAAENVQTASFKIEGMTCAIGCAKTIEKELSELSGVEKATVDFEKKTATVIFDKTIQNPDNLTKVVQEAGDGKSYKVSDMKS